MVYEKERIPNIFSYLRRNNNDCIVVPYGNLKHNWSQLRLDASSAGYIVTFDSEANLYYFIRRYVA